MKRLLFFVVSFVAAAAAAGCGSGSEAAGSASADGEWVLDALLVDSEPASEVPEQPVDFRVANGQVQGSTGCNSMGGQALFNDDGSLQVKDLFQTEMACMDQSVMDFEARYTAALLAADSWELSEAQLIVRGPQATMTYVRRVAPPDLPLTDTTWSLDTFFDGQAASHSVGMDAITVRFFDDAVQMTGPCWSIRGLATIEPGGEGNLSADFTVGEAEFTCEGREFFDAMVEGVGRVNEYRIDERRLTLDFSGESVLSLNGT